MGAVLVGVVIIILLLGNNAPTGGSLPNSGSNVQNGANKPVPNNPASQPSVQTANLPGTPVPDEGKSHVSDGETITYKNYPPSSGSHYGTTADYGFSETEVAEGKLVHDLEHGAIVLYYKPDLPADVLNNLRQVYNKLPAAKYGKVKLVIMPYSKLQTPLAIAAWTRVQPFSEYNFEQIKAFYQALVDKGPEDVP